MMKKLRWQFLIMVLALASIGVLLLGRQPTVQTEEIEPTSGGVYSEGLVGSFERLNPLLDFSNDADRAIDRLLYSSLVRFDSRGIPVPDLAESWAVSQDGTTYNFALRPEAIWHDGTPVTSEDVIFTVEMMRDQEIPVPANIRELWNEVEVKQLDERTLQFILPEAYTPFINELDFGILPSHLLGNLTAPELINAVFNLQPEGSGPYQFERLLVEGDEITGVVLRAFEDYFKSAPFIDQVVFRYYPDSEAALKAYQEGEVLGLSQVSPEVLMEALREDSLNIYTARLPQLVMIYLNLDHPEVTFFQDSTVRKALLYGINRQWIIDRLMDGQAIITEGPVLPGTWAYYDGIEQYGFDKEKAIGLLKGAGYTLREESGAVRRNDDGPLRFELLYPDDDSHKSVVEVIKDYWADIGVRADLKPVPYEALINEHLNTRNYQAVLVDIDFKRSPDPDPYPFWHQTQISGGQNYANWDDRPASEYLEQARITLNLEVRARLYQNFQARFANELPALPLYYPVYSYGVDEQVQGIRLGSILDTSDRFANVSDWFLLAKRTAQLPGTPTVTP